MYRILCHAVTLWFWPLVMILLAANYTKNNENSVKNWFRSRAWNIIGKIPECIDMKLIQMAENWHREIMVLCSLIRQNVKIKRKLQMDVQNIFKAAEVRCESCRLDDTSISFFFFYSVLMWFPNRHGFNSLFRLRPVTQVKWQ